MVRPLGSDTITILKPDIQTDTTDNTLYFDWSSPTEIEVEGCSFQPFLPSDKLQFEDSGDRDFARSTWRIYAPYTLPVLAISKHDRIRFQDQEYEVFGLTGSWRRFNGAGHHVQIIVQLREG